MVAKADGGAVRAGLPPPGPAAPPSRCAWSRLACEEDRVATTAPPLALAPPPLPRPGTELAVHSPVLLGGRVPPSPGSQPSPGCNGCCGGSSKSSRPPLPALPRPAAGGDEGKVEAANPAAPWTHTWPWLRLCGRTEPPPAPKGFGPPPPPPPKMEDSKERAEGRGRSRLRPLKPCLGLCAVPGSVAGSSQRAAASPAAARGCSSVRVVVGEMEGERCAALDQCHVPRPEPLARGAVLNSRLRTHVASPAVGSAPGKRACGCGWCGFRKEWTWLRDGGGCGDGATKPARLREGRRRARAPRSLQEARPRMGAWAVGVGGRGEGHE